MRKAGGNWFSYYLGRENIALRITGWSRRCSVLSFGVCFYIYSKFSVPRDENITRTWIVGFVSERRRRGLCVVVFAGFLHFNQKGPFSGEKPVNQRIPHALQLRNNNNQREGTIKGRHGRGGYEKGDRKHVVCVCVQSLGQIRRTWSLFGVVAFQPPDPSRRIPLALFWDARRSLSATLPTDMLVVARNLFWRGGE